MKNETGMKIRKLRRELDITQDELGKEIGLQNGKYISHIESGFRNCSNDYAEIILNALNKLKTKKRGNGSI
jgi:transcriptional regulator with XRE-family HTH domain